MVWGALLSVGAAALGAGGSMAAGDKAAKGAEAAAQAQMSMYRQNRADLAPYRETGNQMLNAYAQGLGLPGYGAEETNALRLLSGVRTKDKSGNRNVYVDDYTGDLYRLGQFGDYEQIGNIMAADGRNGKLGAVESNKNRGVYYVDGQLRSHGQNLGSFAIKDRPVVDDTTPVGGGFKESPGYQFRFDEGQRAVDRNAAARGRYLSGAREKASIRYGQDYASNEYNNYMNRLAAGAGIGQTAVNTGVSAGGYAASNAGNAMIGASNARASGYMGAINTGMNAFNNWQASQAYQKPYHDNSGNSTWGPYAGGYRRG